MRARHALALLSLLHPLQLPECDARAGLRAACQPADLSFWDDGPSACQRGDHYDGRHCETFELAGVFCARAAVLEGNQGAQGEGTRQAARARASATSPTAEEISSPAVKAEEN